jgi:hypothetical protein
MKTSELTGAALDWAVAKCEGYTCLHKTKGVCRTNHNLLCGPQEKRMGWLICGSWGTRPTGHKAGAIIEREKIG